MILRNSVVERLLYKEKTAPFAGGGFFWGWGLVALNCYIAINLAMMDLSLTVGDLTLVYQEENPGDRSTVFFMHGNSNSSRLWHKQYKDHRFSGYRLIAFDLPAHGKSDAVPDPGNDYSLPFLARIMAEAVSSLDNGKPYILAGLSLGTNIVAEMLAYDLTPAGIILAGPDVVGGTYTLEKAVKPGTEAGVLFEDTAPEEAVGRYAAMASLSGDVSDRQLLIDDYYRVKPPFRSELLKTAIDGRFSDEIALLQDSGLPVLVIFGKDEQLLNTNYLDEAPFALWEGCIVKIPGASHFVNLDQPEAFNQLVGSYLQARLSV
jgi:pimeloyl-ACP methyl ester carboxylesterase